MFELDIPGSSAAGGWPIPDSLESAGSKCLVRLVGDSLRMSSTGLRTLQVSLSRSSVTIGIVDDDAGDLVAVALGGGAALARVSGGFCLLGFCARSSRS